MYTCICAYVILVADWPPALQPSSRVVKGVTYANKPPILPTIGSLILNFSSLTTRRISRTNAPDCCCNPRSHIQTDNDPTQLSSRVGIWDRALRWGKTLQGGGTGWYDKIRIRLHSSMFKLFSHIREMLGYFENISQVVPENLFFSISRY